MGQIFFMRSKGWTLRGGRISYILSEGGGDQNFFHVREGGPVFFYHSQRQGPEKMMIARHKKTPPLLVKNDTFLSRTYSEVYTVLKGKGTSSIYRRVHYYKMTAYNMHKDRKFRLIKGISISLSLFGHLVCVIDGLMGCIHHSRYDSSLSLIANNDAAIYPLSSHLGVLI